MRRTAEGFTLVELIVVVLLVGILAALAVPNYVQSVENTRADDAIATIKMVGITNRMYALDNNGSYATGTIDTSCNGAACSAPGQAACNIVACNYLAKQDWGAKPYNIFVCDTAAGAGCPGGAAGMVAKVQRKTSGTGSTTLGPYSTWGYSVNVNGVISAINGAPAPAGL